ncbi:MULTISPECIES: hypothetical protein [Rhodococcus]|jgi:hypothetical protein|uniref:Uncharacterized protein n=1 Tax=Rhodococcus aetherivorans TaxID=191292 RepID=N1M6Z4_9NOCA|nr:MULTISPECIES: hypothetical protein [Rhodococcus]NCL77783.1 hypothetical protein [Rhodococcus sp. YH1]MBC2591144.1 hypothetical protein [Rhodococcus aetherivorans]QPG45066.1 hypothetical protein ISO16_25115 [Rhodococcus sp. M8]QRI75404.1 hypothetical protein JQ505_23170 [Rhodococcus aetherivorans]QSE58814.1 hypothetical protein JYA75_24275 [Rhodococcus sp. PSBB066]
MSNETESAVLPLSTPVTMSIVRAFLAGAPEDATLELDSSNSAEPRLVLTWAKRQEG